LFRVIGSKFIDPNYENEEKTSEDFEMEKIRRQTVKISKDDKNSQQTGKKGCC
jgi:hypothetical protein